MGKPMKRLGVAIIALVVLIVLVAIYLQRREEVRLTEFIPEEALLYLSDRNLGVGWEKVKGSNFWGRVTELELWEPVVKELDRKKKLKKLDEKSLLNLLGREFIVAFLGLKPSKVPSVLFISRVGDRGMVEEELREMGIGKTQTERYEGMMINLIPEYDLSYIFLRDIFVICNDGVIVRKVVDIYNGGEGSLMDSEMHTKVMAKLPPGGDGLAYIDVEGILELVRPILEGIKLPNTEKILSTYESFSAIGSKSFSTGEGFHTTIYTLFSGKETELLKLYRVRKGPLRSLAFLPSGAILFASMKMNLEAYFNFLLDLYREDPFMGPRIDGALSQIRSEWGIDLEKDILYFLGEEFSYSLLSMEMKGWFPIPKILLVVELKDREKVATILSNLDLSDLERKEEEYRGYRLLSFPIPFLLGVAPSYCLVGDFFVVSLSPETLRMAIDLHLGEGEPIQEDEDFIRLRLSSDVSGVSYINVEKGLEVGKELISYLANFLRFSYQSQAEWAMELPPLLETLKVFKLMGGTYIYEEEGILQDIFIIIEDLPTIEE